jgi:hypothetical protein
MAIFIPYVGRDNINTLTLSRILPRYKFWSQKMKKSSRFEKFYSVNRMTRDRCYDFLNIFAEFFGKKIAFLTKNKAKLIIALAF